MTRSRGGRSFRRGSHRLVPILRWIMLIKYAVHSSEAAPAMVGGRGRGFLHCPLCWATLMSSPCGVELWTLWFSSQRWSFSEIRRLRSLKL
jgi:hypothetical protein